MNGSDPLHQIRKGPFPFIKLSTELNLGAVELVCHLDQIRSGFHLSEFVSDEAFIAFYISVMFKRSV